MDKGGSGVPRPHTGRKVDRCLVTNSCGCGCKICGQIPKYLCPHISVTDHIWEQTENIFCLTQTRNGVFTASAHLGYMSDKVIIINYLDEHQEHSADFTTVAMYFCRPFILT